MGSSYQYQSVTEYMSMFWDSSDVITRIEGCSDYKNIDDLIKRIR